MRGGKTGEEDGGEGLHRAPVIRGKAGGGGSREWEDR